ncbi:MAG: aminoacyl-tRNA hydrolase [Thermoguttaceae bacterium]
MKLVVGLGNPGREYSQTRHNIGYIVLAELASRWGAGERPRTKFHADTLDVTVQGEKVLLLCPTTYMNRSGLAVGEAAAFYKLTPNEVLVVGDDMDLPCGQLRFRERGSSGGQKGLRDVLRALGTEEVPRLRVGIGRPPERVDAADYVLATFAPEERAMLPQILHDAVAIVEMWVTQGAAAVVDHNTPRNSKPQNSTQRNSTRPAN